MQQMKEFVSNHNYYKERRHIRRRIRREFVPLEGSLKSLFKSGKPKGQLWRYYFPHLYREVKFTLSCTFDRIWYGQASRSYYDLDRNLIIMLRNGIAMLAEMSTGYSPLEFETYDAWIAELKRMRNYIDDYLFGDDVVAEKEYEEVISAWVGKYLTHLWD